MRHTAGRNQELRARGREGRKEHHQDTKAPRAGKGMRIPTRLLIFGICAELGLTKVSSKKRGMTNLFGTKEWDTDERG